MNQGSSTMTHGSYWADVQNYDSFLSNSSIGKNCETFIGIMMSEQRQYYHQRRYPTEITMEVHIK